MEPCIEEWKKQVLVDLERDPDSLDAWNRKGQTLLFRAVGMPMTDHAAELTKWVLKRGADVNRQSTDLEFPYRLSPLSQAIRQDSVELVHLLANAPGCDLEALDSHQVSPLQLAIVRGNTEIVRLLLDAGCRVNPDPGEKCYTPLHTACEKEHIDIIKLLLERGADPNVPDVASGTSPAFLTFSVPIYKLLIHHGLDVNTVGPYGHTLLGHVINAMLHDDILYSLHTQVPSLEDEIKNMVALDFLLSAGCNLNFDPDEFLLTPGDLGPVNRSVHRICHGCPLRKALNQGRYDVCKLLIQHGCNVDQLTQKSVRMLFELINSNDLDLIYTILHAVGCVNWRKLITEKEDHRHSRCGVGLTRHRILSKEIKDTVMQMSNHFFPLKHRCRVVIRKQLQWKANGRSIFGPVDQLPLPEPVKCYLKLQNVQG